MPEDFLTLLLRAEGPNGLTRGEIEDNIITFIGAGHETTARALGWTIYCLAEAPWERERDRGARSTPCWRASPTRSKWLDAMPLTRAAFEEAMRLYPPAPSINREPIEPTNSWRDLDIPPKARRAGHAVDGAPAPQAVGPARRLHAVALPSRRTATRSTATSTCRSAPVRASASAPASPCRRRSSRWPC